MAARVEGNSSNNVPLSVPVITRPEIGSNYLHTFHNYGTQTQNDQVDNVISAISKSREAMTVELAIEKQLFDDGTVSKCNPCLMSLEKTLLDLSVLTEGIVYAVAIQLAHHTVLRFIETGCYDGFMAECGEKIISKYLRKEEEELLPWCVYTNEDVASYQSDNCERKIRGTSHSRRTRSDLDYTRLMKTNKSSVINQFALLKQSINGQQQTLKVPFGLVHVLKKEANAKRTLDRFTDYLLMDVECHTLWDDALTSYITKGKQELTQAQKFQNDLSLKDQFLFLSIIPNYHWSTYLRIDGSQSRSKYTSFIQHFAYQDVKDSTEEENHQGPEYYPSSYRNRIIHFTNKGNTRYVKQMVQRWLMPSITEESESNLRDDGPSVEPVAKRCRRYQPRVIKVHPQLLPGTRPRFNPERSLFTSFTEQLITYGTVKWRTHTEDMDVFLLSDYSIETGHILSNCAHTTCIKTDDAQSILHCTCDSYKYLQSMCATGDNTDEIFIEGQYSCMHVRFFKEFLITTMTEVQNENFDQSGGTLLEKKVVKSKKEVNNGIVVVGTLSRNTYAQFSVKGKTDTCSFVTISNDGKLITCKSGTCQANLLNRRKIPSLLSLSSLKICEHLETMKAHKDIWGFLCDNIHDFPQSDSVEVDRDDAELLLQESNSDIFNSDTGLWYFGGMSDHQPKEQVDLTLSRCVRHRVSINDETHDRDKEGFLTGINLVPDIPSECQCGAGFSSENLLEDYDTKLYTKYAPLRCSVFKRLCTGGNCTHRYSGKKDCLHQWSKDTCAGDELGWTFVREVMKKKTSFSAFCDCLTTQYKEPNVLSAPFMSKTTFVKWFFSWAAALKIDFRKDVDPWCKHDPKFLACDGTHVGVSIHQLNLQNPVEAADLNETLQTRHKRYDRVFLPYKAGVHAKLVASARRHLDYLCSKILSQIPNHETLSEQEQTAQNENLMLSSPNDDRVTAVLGHLIDRSYNQDLLQAMAYFVKGLSKDAAVSNFLPLRYHQSLLHICERLRNDGPDLNLVLSVGKFSPEIANILKHSLEDEYLNEILNFIIYLVEFITSTHTDDPETPNAVPIPGTYRPDKGVAYYFTPHGCQVRKMPKYEINSKNSNFDDHPNCDNCSKIYPSVSRGGYSYIFLWFCPIHGHSYGFHIISGSEGRKDPFSSLYKYLPQPPENIFYDFACSLSEYSLNRAPSYFKNVCIYHDIFHGLSHKCPFCFRSRRLASLNMTNSEICEQFNSFLQAIKYTSSHLTQNKFCFFLQFFIHMWNKKKTEAFERKREIVFAGFD